MTQPKQNTVPAKAEVHLLLRNQPLDPSFRIYCRCTNCNCRKSETVCFIRVRFIMDLYAVMCVCAALATLV